MRSPGVVRIPAGSRVADAVERAGGASGGADLTQVNLARVAVDPNVGIDQAKADWKAGRMKLPTEDDLEFIPLPEEPPLAQPAPAPVEPKPTDPG